MRTNLYLPRWHAPLALSFLFANDVTDHRFSNMVETPDELIPTRATLLERLKDWQDQASWQDFFDTYWGLIYSVARKGGLTKTEAQDVVQETMLAVAKRIPGFRYDRAIGSFKAWLLQTTRWRIADQLRKRPLLREGVSQQADTTAGLLASMIHPDSLELDALWEQEWKNNLMAVAIANVKRRADPQKYQIFDFYTNKEWSADAVARTFGVPVSQVYMAKHRVTEMIKAEVTRLQAGMT